jgi:EAL domain-containing protein (putative c-di-GMP-specific phosphodiesterase class I)
VKETTKIDPHTLDAAQLSMAFQPVYDISKGPGEQRQIDHFEALMRGPAGTNLESPAIFFDLVRREKAEPKVDRSCVTRALEVAARVPALSINVHAGTLERDTEFAAFLADAAHSAGLPLSRLVLEITGHAPEWDGKGLRRALSDLRRQGARIALDDVGTGTMSYRMMLNCRPDYFKLDRFITQGANLDRTRQAIIASVVTLAGGFGSKVIAVGIEFEADLDVMGSLGIELVQGFWLGKPVAADELETV